MPGPHKGQPEQEEDGGKEHEPAACEEAEIHVVGMKGIAQKRDGLFEGFPGFLEGPHPHPVNGFILMSPRVPFQMVHLLLGKRTGFSKKECLFPGWSREERKSPSWKTTVIHEEEVRLMNRTAMTPQRSSESLAAVQVLSCFLYDM